MRRKGDPVRGNLGSPGGFARTSRRLVGEGVQTTRGNLDERHSHGVRQAVHEARPEVVVERLEEELRPAAER